MQKRMLSVFFTVLLLLSLAACGGAADSGGQRTVYTMDTVMSLTIYDENAGGALDAAEQVLRDLNDLLDRHSETSAVSALNRDGTIYSPPLAELTETALAVNAATDGAFDPTVAPVLDAWDFTGSAPRVPAEDELSALLARVGAENVGVSDGVIALANGAQLDFGGIAKGFAGDEVRRTLEELGVSSAVIDLGGDVGVLGAKPDGGDWRIAVKDPADSSRFLGVLSVSDRFVVTSGAYERGFERDGVRYHHILDPKTGRPAQSGLVSVTVVCESGVWADALSTACFVLGEEESLALRDRLAAEDAADFELILVTDDGRVRCTDGLKDRFAPSGEGGYVYEQTA